MRHLKLLAGNLESILEGCFLTCTALFAGVLGCIPLGVVWTYTEIRDAWWAHFNLKGKK